MTASSSSGGSSGPCCLRFRRSCSSAASAFASSCCLTFSSCGQHQATWQREVLFSQGPVWEPGCLSTQFHCLAAVKLAQAAPPSRQRGTNTWPTVLRVCLRGTSIPQPAQGTACYAFGASTLGCICLHLCSLLASGVPVPCILAAGPWHGRTGTHWLPTPWPKLTGTLGQLRRLLMQSPTSTSVWPASRSSRHRPQAASTISNTNWCSRSAQEEQCAWQS